MVLPQPFHPITTPGGYVLIVYEKCPAARKTLTPTIMGNAVAGHFGFQQEKYMLIRWHPQNLDVEALVAVQEINGYIRRDQKTEPAMDATVNLFNTEVMFVRYMAELDSATQAYYTT